MEKKLEIHVGFKFSKADMMNNTINPYKDGVYAAYIATDFEGAYNWTLFHNSPTTWNDIIYKDLNLPEVDVVVSGRALNANILSHEGELLGSNMDESCEPPKRASEELDILANVQIDEISVFIQGDKLHDAIQVSDKYTKSMESAVAIIREELTKRAIHIAQFKEAIEFHPEIPEYAMAEWYRDVLRQSSIRGVKVDAQDVCDKYASVYNQLKKDLPLLTAAQLMHGASVQAAAELAKTQFFKSDKQIYMDVSEAAIDKLEYANYTASIYNLTPSRLIEITLQKIPPEAHTEFRGIWTSNIQTASAVNPGASQQRIAVLAMQRTLQETGTMLSELNITEDTYQQLCEKNEEDIKYIDSIDMNVERTPFDD
jgi:hypothetical protein